MLNKEEFLRLQKLAAISLDDQETAKLATQLWTIVDFLWKLQKISASTSSVWKTERTLIPVSWTRSYDSGEMLFANVTHEKLGNSIVVNSVVDN